MQLEVHISELQEIKTGTDVRKNKDTEEIQLITVVRFQAAMPPESLLQLHRLIEIGAPLNCVIKTDQTVMDFEQSENGKIKGTLKAD